MRIFNAEECHRPKGRENDPRSDCEYFAIVYVYNRTARSAVYINTGKGKALCTFAKLQNAVNGSLHKAHNLMNKLNLPEFPTENLKRVRDYDMKTPSEGIVLGLLDMKLFFIR